LWSSQWTDAGMARPTDFDRLGDLLGEACGLPPPSAQGAPRAGAAKHDRSSPPSSGASPSGPVDQAAPRALAKLLSAIWPEVVGDEVAANAQPVQLKRGRLVVSASSSSWAQTLQLMGDAIVARVNEHLGDGVVERVVFRHAGWDERPPGLSSAERPVGRHLERRENLPRPAPSSRDGATASGGVPGGGGLDPAVRAETLSAEERTVLAEVEGLDLSPGLREQIGRAIEAAFGRAQQDSVR